MYLNKTEVRLLIVIGMVAALIVALTILSAHSTDLPSDARISGFGYLTDGTYVADIDSNGSLITVDYERHLLNIGHAYIANHYQADSGAYKWAVRTPSSDTLIHINWYLTAAGAGVMSLYGLPTIESTSGVLTPLNRNCNYATTNPGALEVLYGVTATTQGVHRYTTFVSSGSGPKPIGGESGTRAKHILLPDTEYLITWTPDSGTGKLLFEAEWYEVTE